jgi:hypothetical protein
MHFRFEKTNLLANMFAASRATIMFGSSSAKDIEEEDQMTATSWDLHLVGCTTWKLDLQLACRASGCLCLCCHAAAFLAPKLCN